MTNMQSHDDGTLSDAEHDWLTARARGGFGLVTTCAAYVAPSGQAWRGQLGISSDDHLPGLRRLADSLHSHGARCSVQLHHGGRRADPALAGQPVGPWEDPSTGTRALATGEVAELVADFVAAAVRAEQAGFDGAEVHGAHSFVLDQFLDHEHDRSDAYGGSLQGRMRPLMDVLEGIRQSTSSDFQLGLRLAPEGQGLALAQGLEVMRQVLATGWVDYLDVSLRDVFRRPRGDGAAWDERRVIEYLVDLPRGKTMLGVSGAVRSAADVRWCLDQGADLVFLGTAAIIHHDVASRILADPEFQTRPQPVSREVLEAEGVTPVFMSYLDDGWDDIVAS